MSGWHEQIGDPTLADGILDRLVHNAHRIEMRGDSMRKNRGKASPGSSVDFDPHFIPEDRERSERLLHHQNCSAYLEC